jgi:hypothetical protein
MKPGGPIAFARQETPFMRFPDASWFAVFYRGGAQLDHTILYNGLGSSIEHARRADAIFLGNSQMQFALPMHELREFERRSRVRPFSLALPFGEGYRFPFRILEKFDLRPGVVVVSVGRFFREDESPAALQVMREGWWGGWTQVAEERIAARIWPFASAVFPSFIALRPPWYILRSSDYGTWQPVAWPHDHVAVTEVATDPSLAVPAAARLRSALARRGTQLVLTCVPTFRAVCSPASTRALAEKIGVRAVVPTVDRLWTGDLAHLCPLSGKRYGRALLRELGELDVIRAMARGKVQDRAAR